VTNNKNCVSPIERTIIFDRLVTKGDFELAYTKGTPVISEDKKIKARYIFSTKNKTNKVKIGLSVASKKGNSVWRNRIKRILRESIRTERETLRIFLEKRNADLLIIFSPYSFNQTNSKKIFLREIKPAVLDILNRIVKQPQHIK
jgi:ribonuclease P protein component